MIKYICVLLFSFILTNNMSYSRVRINWIETQIRMYNSEKNLHSLPIPIIVLSIKNDSDLPFEFHYREKGYFILEVGSLKIKMEHNWGGESKIILPKSNFKLKLTIENIMNTPTPKFYNFMLKIAKEGKLTYYLGSEEIKVVKENDSLIFIDGDLNDK